MVYGRLKITTSIKDGVKRNFINVQGHDIDILSSKKVQNEI